MLFVTVSVFEASQSDRDGKREKEVVVFYDFKAVLDDPNPKLFLKQSLSLNHFNLRIKNGFFLSENAYAYDPQRWTDAPIEKIKEMDASSYRLVFATRAR